MNRLKKRKQIFTKKLKKAKAKLQPDHKSLAILLKPIVSIVSKWNK